MELKPKKSPGENYESAFEQTLSDGIEFDILEKSGDWFKVRLLNEEICWLPKDSIIFHKGSIVFK